MNKISTFIYVYSNFEEFDILSDEFSESNLEEFDDITRLLDENTIKAPEFIVNNILEIARHYS